MLLFCLLGETWLSPYSTWHASIHLHTLLKQAVSFSSMAMFIHIQVTLVINESKISDNIAFKKHVQLEGFLKEIFMPVVIFPILKEFPLCIGFSEWYGAIVENCRWSWRQNEHAHICAGCTVSLGYRMSTRLIYQLTLKFVKAGRFL